MPRRAMRLYRMNDISPKDFTTTALLSLFLGTFGAHRYYAGKIGTGLLMLFTLGGVGIWSLVDLITILCLRFQDADGLRITGK